MQRLIALMAAIVLAAPAAMAQQTRIDDPSAFIANVYDDLKNDGWPPDASGIFTARLSALVWPDFAPGAQIGFDFWTDAQDFDLSDVTIAAADTSFSRRTVTASFRNFGQMTRVHFHWMRQDGGGWLIDDVTSDNGWTLSDLLRSAGAPPAPGEEW
ncbi:MAG: hypothetical protein KIS81_08920 [Maricaulaceae bacterium]|nr:hypothetical protein [Maricaulaceae bacterium]